MIAAVAKSRTELFRSYLMARAKIDPKDYGIDLTLDAFTDQMVEQLAARYRGQITIDELLLHPREALLFCDQVRQSLGYFLLPDDVILRPIMTRRKNPGR